MKVYIIRHAESVNNTAGTVAEENSPLSANGVKQANDLAEKLKDINLQAIYTSIQKRAIETASILSKYHHLKIIKSDLLVDKKEATSTLGQRKEDLPWDEIKKMRADPEWKHEDGESFNEVKKRVQCFISELERFDSKSDVLVITHNSFIKHLILYILLGEGLSPVIYYKIADRMETKNSGVTIIECKQKYYESTPSWYLQSWMV